MHVGDAVLTASSEELDTAWHYGNLFFKFALKNVPTKYCILAIYERVFFVSGITQRLQFTVYVTKKPLYRSEVLTEIVS